MTGGNHEYDGAQFEINLQHSEALSAADRAFRFKAAIKELARRDGGLATFMGKPFDDAGGSGFHVHLSCGDGPGNCFDDPSAPHGLSTMARHAIAAFCGTLRPWRHWPTRPSTPTRDSAGTRSRPG